MLKRIISVAPMMDYTDRHCRYFLRLISRQVLLYTEMITAHAITQGDREYLLKYHPAEHPVAFQIGGSNPQQLAVCAKIIEDYGYDEINLNVGCPSANVTEGHFGACLMKNPNLVAECMITMQQNVKIPITIKTRIGVDEFDSYEYLKNFIQLIAATGCKIFVIHARKAWLQGLSPKENREIPPLHYEVVYQLKKDFPNLIFIINGGIKTLVQAQEHLSYVDGVMIGREAYHNPYMLAKVDELFYGDTHPAPSRQEVVAAFISYVEEQLRKGRHLKQLTHPILGLFQGLPGARAFRRYISENAHRAGASVATIIEAVKRIN